MERGPSVEFWLKQSRSLQDWPCAQMSKNVKWILLEHVCASRANILAENICHWNCLIFQHDQPLTESINMQMSRQWALSKTFRSQWMDATQLDGIWKFLPVVLLSGRKKNGGRFEIAAQMSVKFKDKMPRTKISVRPRVNDDPAHQIHGGAWQVHFRGKYFLLPPLLMQVHLHILFKLI